MQHINRIAPQGGVADYKTYQIVSPLSTHWEPANCVQVNCPDYHHGWRVRIEGLPPEMIHAARTSGRKYSELEISANDHWLVFESGQPCFRAAEHRRLLDKQEIFIVRDGDFRGNPTGNVRRHTRPADWQEDFAEHQDKLAQQIKQG
jgi:hypothetical protein